jgi:hypothetical protein
MSDPQADQVREEAYRAAAGAVDRLLERIGDPAADHVDEVGSGGWNRFRAEMGRVVDLNLDMVRNAFGLYGTLLSPESFRQQVGADVLVLGPVVPGTTASSILWLHNYDDEPVDDVAFVGSPLTAPGEELVDAPRWLFSPPTISVPARSAVPVMVEVEVPDDVPAGAYEATVTPRARPGQAIDVRVEVVAAAAIPHDSW